MRGATNAVGILAEQIPMGNGGKAHNQPENYYYASSLTAAQVTALPEEVDGKNRLASEQILISNLYLCLREKGQDELHKMRPHLDLTTTRYPRVLDAMEGEFKKEWNGMYEVFQLLSCKQRIGESLEQFHSVHSRLAARCAFGTLESKILRDIFIVKMTNREAQNELCRATKTPEEAYWIALSYKRGDKYARTYVATTGGTGVSSEPMAGGLQIRLESEGVIRGGYRNNRGRGRRQPQGRGHFRGGKN